MMADISWDVFTNNVLGTESYLFKEAWKYYSGEGVLNDSLRTNFEEALNSNVFDNLLMEINEEVINAIKYGRDPEIQGRFLDLASFGRADTFGKVDFKASDFKIRLDAVDPFEGPYIGDRFGGMKDVALLHYARNILLETNVTPFDLAFSDKYIKQADALNAFHKSNKAYDDEFNNTKWMDADAQQEFILITSDAGFRIEENSLRFGTYNYGKGAAHMALDVHPWTAFGNLPENAQNVYDRKSDVGDAIAYGKYKLEDWTNGNNQNNYYSSLSMKLLDAGNNEYHIPYDKEGFVSALGGNDTIYSGPFADKIWGGNGEDTVSYKDSDLGVIVNLEKGVGKTGYASHDYVFEELNSIENLIGSDSGDIIIGDSSSNRLDGAGGNDLLSGRYGNDTLIGGAGEDTAVYIGNAHSYTVTKNADGTYSVARKSIRGFTDAEMATLTEGTDTLKFIEKLRFADGEKAIDEFLAIAPNGEETAILNDADGDKIGAVTIEAPTQSQGTEVEFNINLSTSGIGTQYRIALIMDTSGSMGGTRINDAKAAYVDLINYLKDQGVADVTEFAVIPFTSGATLYEGLGADDAIAKINSLYAGGGTMFEPAIQRGLEFFDGAKDGISNIVYFLSDGQGSGASTALQDVADVRAFGIGSGASIDSLNVIDSNNAVILNSASDLAASFTESEIKTADIDKIELYVNDNLVDTITSDQLTDNGATGLNFKGAVGGLDPTKADKLEAKVLFSDTSIPAQSVVFEIGDGVTEAAGTSGDDYIAFSLTQEMVDAGGGSDTVFANDLDNVVVKVSGNGVIKTFGGDDTVYAGDNRTSGLDRVIDGGDGIDTVVYIGNFSEYKVAQTGGLLKVGTATDSLTNIEFLQFDDVKVRTSDLSVVQTLAIATAEVTEKDESTTLDFTIKLDAATSSDVTFDYQTVDGTANAGSDFSATSGTITFAAGETEKTISVEILGDTDFEADESFELKLSNLNGAIFADGNDTFSVVGTIKNDDDSNQFETGSLGDDVINTGKGDDFISPGAGNDTVNANIGNDVILDGMGNDKLAGDAGNDALAMLSGINSASGGGQSDLLVGGFQADTLEGGSGNDVIRGDASNWLGATDTINGGTGDDVMMGGKGADTFVFKAGDGNDIIGKFSASDVEYSASSGYAVTPTGRDFQTTYDKIQLVGFATVTKDNVLSSIANGDDGAVFSAEGTSITFFGVTADEITDDVFVFV